MLERLLVPLDTSEIAEQVLPWVTLLASGLGQPVALLSVIADGAALNPVASAYAAAIADLTERRAYSLRRYLESVRARLQAQGVQATAAVFTGGIAEGSWRLQRPSAAA